MEKQFNRRTFLQSSVMAGAGLAVPGKLAAEEYVSQSNHEKEVLRIGIIGSGLRGQSHIGLALNRKDCEIVAVCDISPFMIERTKSMFDKRGIKQPLYFTDGPLGYMEMLENTDVDAVIIATPWRWHSKMAIDSMNAGKYVGVEVCGAFSIDECWELVNTHERTGSHLFFLENVCYRRDVMAILNMVRKNLFGEMIHLQCGYQHDLRGVKFNNGEKPFEGGVEFGEKGFSEASWRTVHSVNRNGDLYPTHGIGPVAQYININKGNRLLQLTSMSSKSRGLKDYVINHPDGGTEHPNAKLEYRLGDVTTTMVNTANGETILLMHDTNLPRPYSLGFRVQGTKGIWMDVNKSLHIEGMSEPHRWEAAESYIKEYDHPLWKKYEEKAVGAGHGGMDFFLLNSFVESAKKNSPAPIDVYDAATWMAITPLSEESIQQGGASMSIPDFTRGKWMFRENNFATGDNY